MCVCENLSFFVFICNGLGCFLVPCLGTVHCCFLCESSVSISLQDSTYITWRNGAKEIEGKAMEEGGRRGSWSKNV